MMKSMCAQLNEVTEDEWEDLRSMVKSQGRKIDSLMSWKNMIVGGFSVITLLMGAVLWIFDRTLSDIDTSQAAIIEMQKQLAVFQQEVKPYLIAGPRFTHNDYAILSRSQELELKEWVREFVPTAETLERFGRLEKRVGDLEMKQN